MKTDETSTKDISWEEIQQYIDKNDSYKGFFEQIPLSIYKMAINKEEKAKVIRAIVKVLHEKDLANASEEYAQKVADMMENLALEILKKRGHR